MRKTVLIKGRVLDNSGALDALATSPAIMGLSCSLLLWHPNANAISV
jgi:hypothetical protein